MLTNSIILSSVWLFMGINGQFGDWTMLGGRPHEPTCVDIPESMTLCSNIGYDKMRLPNLLGHDTLAEVKQQSGSWVPLLKIKCHPYTKLFMCSLFAPVCLENEIFPCRSLCEQVQAGCESRINNYGFKWPDMLRCDKFPVDNDMCIKPTYKKNHTIEDIADTPCTACSPVESYENILDNFCRSDFVLRARINQQKKYRLRLKKVKVFKMKNNTKSNKFQLYLDEESSCCSFQTKKQRFLIMGKYGKDGKPNPNFILEWSKSKILIQAVNMFKELDCNDPNLFTPDMDDGSILPKQKIKKGKRRRGKKIKNRRKKINKRKNRKRKMRRNKKKQRRKNKEQ